MKSCHRLFTTTVISVDDINIDSTDNTLGAPSVPTNHGLQREQRQENRTDQNRVSTLPLGEVI